jgi:hypothetical protein
MQERGKPATVRVITFTEKPQEEEKKDEYPHVGGGKGGNKPKHPPRVPIESLPDFIYNKATDKNVGKDTTSEDIVKQLNESKSRGYPVIRFKYNARFDQ